jgi:hypothetical protein
MPEITVTRKDVEDYVRWTLSPLNEADYHVEEIVAEFNAQRTLDGHVLVGHHPMTTTLRADTVLPWIHLQPRRSTTGRS